jgi:dUTPase
LLIVDWLSFSFKSNKKSTDENSGRGTGGFGSTGVK